MARRVVESTLAPQAIRGIVSAAALITLGNLASRVLGLVREGVIAALFGETAVTSAFVTATTVPTMLYDLVVGGAVSAALIPVFAEYAGRSDEKGREELGRIAGSVAVLALVALSVTAGILALFAPALVRVLGVVDDSDVQAQTIVYVRIALPSVIFLGLSSIVTAVLYARQQFVFPAFAVAMYNAGIIVGAITLAPTIGATSLVLGVLIGALLQLAFQTVGLRGSNLRLSVDFRHPAVSRILMLYAPVAFGLVVSQVGVVIDRNLAWRTGADSVAVMRFATTLIQLPLGLVATATSFAILPRLARFAEDSDGLSAYKQTLATGLRLVVLAMAPITVLVIVLRVPLVQLLFEREAFDAAATAATATAVLFYAPQLPFAAVDQLLIFAFYARKNTLTPALVGLGGVGVYLAFGLLLIGPANLGVRGLVLANTLQNSIHAVVLLLLLWRAIGWLTGFGVGRATAKAALATGAMAVVCWALLPYVQLDRGAGALFISIGLVSIVAGAVYVVGLALLRTREVADAAGLARRLVGRLRSAS